MTRALKREASGIVFVDSWRRVDPEQCSTLAGPGGAYDRTAIAIGVVRGGVAHGCGAIREMAQESIAMTTTTSTTPYGARKTHAGNTRPTASWGSRSICQALPKLSLSVQLPRFLFVVTYTSAVFNMSRSAEPRYLRKSGSVPPEGYPVRSASYQETHIKMRKERKQDSQTEKEESSATASDESRKSNDLANGRSETISAPQGSSTTPYTHSHTNCDTQNR
ncbi:hypothetical protein V8B97DRAFT_1915971 [Scleroderma yunnanense]